MRDESMANAVSEASSLPPQRLSARIERGCLPNEHHDNGLSHAVGVSLTRASLLRHRLPLGTQYSRPVRLPCDIKI